MEMFSGVVLSMKMVPWSVHSNIFSSWCTTEYPSKIDLYIFQPGDAEMPTVGEAPDEDRSSPRPSQRTAAESAPSSSMKKKRRVEGPEAMERPEQVEQVEAMVMDVDVKEDVDALAAVAVDDSTYEKLKLRRLMPGAATSEEDFQKMFLNLGLVNDMFQLEEAEVVDASDTILHKVRLWTDNVKHHMPENLPDYILRLSVGVLAFGRARQADIFIREHALIYWIAEGGKTLRFHAGDCYMKSPSGAFQQRRGVPPDHDRVQMFLLHLEGIFRLMPRNTARTSHDLLQAVQSLWDQANRCENSFLLQCVDACLTFAADPPRGGKAQGKGEDVDEYVPGTAWNATAAKTIMAVKKQVSLELTQDKLLHYMSEWCDAPKLAEAACCYEDCCVRYDVSAKVMAVQVVRASLEHCYRLPYSSLHQRHSAGTHCGKIAAILCTDLLGQPWSL